MTIVWLNPIILTPPHGVSNLEKYHGLLDQFARDGRWGDGKEPLIGYWLTGTYSTAVQLLSGSHRYAAARMAEIFVPVLVREISEVWDAFGDVPRWRRIMDPSVR